jgi:DivIVA domain-containing protein
MLSPPHGSVTRSCDDPLVSLLLVLVLLGVLGAVAVLAAGRGGAMAEASPDRAPGATLPEGEVSREDVDRLSFSLAFRGYRMDEVDATLDRLADQLAERDARIAELEGRTPVPVDGQRSEDDVPSEGERHDG